jgi:hypothetical protein
MSRNVDGLSRSWLEDKCTDRHVRAREDTRSGSCDIHLEGTSHRASLTASSSRFRSRSNSKSATSDRQRLLLRARRKVSRRFFERRDPRPQVRVALHARRPTSEFRTQNSKAKKPPCVFRLSVGRSRRDAEGHENGQHRSQQNHGADPSPVTHSDPPPSGAILARRARAPQREETAGSREPYGGGQLQRSKTQMASCAMTAPNRVARRDSHSSSV